jgi:multiple sugar transport system substrate-binding protein
MDPHRRGQAGEHVDRLDDGTVLLKLGPDYGDAVVEVGASELGGLLGSDARPLAGTTVRVLTQDEGPRGAISGPLAAWAPVFEELSGAKVELELAPVTDLYATMMVDLQQGTGRHDAIFAAAFYYGELIDRGLIRPVDDLAGGDRFPRWSYDALPPSLRSLHTWAARATASRSTPTGRCSTTGAMS